MEDPRVIDLKFRIDLKLRIRDKFPPAEAAALTDGTVYQ